MKRLVSSFEKFKRISRMNTFIGDYKKTKVCEMYCKPGGYHFRFEVTNMLDGYKHYKNNSEFYDSRFSPEYVEILNNFKK